VAAAAAAMTARIRVLVGWRSEGEDGGSAEIFRCAGECDEWSDGLPRWWVIQQFC
jgi:hypothetical protein